MLPRLTEVFVIREANVTTLAQMNKIPVSTAEYINQYDRKNADVLTKIFADQYRDNVDYNVKTYWKDQDQWADMETGWMTAWRDFIRNGGGNEIRKYLNAHPNKKQHVISSYQQNKPNFPKFLSDLAAGTNEKNVGNLKGRAAITFPDGYFWVRLEDDECSIEGHLMQHCGLTDNPDDQMWSLRDPQGKPHVTVQAEMQEGARDKMYQLVQIKGKQNRTPDRKYWPYVKKFVEHFKVENTSDDLIDTEFVRSVGLEYV